MELHKLITWQLCSDCLLFDVQSGPTVPCSHTVPHFSTKKAALKQLEFQCLCVCCVFPGASEPGRELRCAEALGRAPVLPAGQPEVQSHPGAALPGLLLQSGRDAPQVRTSIDAVMSLLYIFLNIKKCSRIWHCLRLRSWKMLSFKMRNTNTNLFHSQKYIHITIQSQYPVSYSPNWDSPFNFFLLDLTLLVSSFIHTRKHLSLFQFLLLFLPEYSEGHFTVYGMVWPRIF